MKVIRSKHIYTKKRSKLKIIIAFALIGALLIGAGWLAAGPIMDMLADAASNQATVSKDSALSSESDESGATNSNATSSDTSTPTATAEWLKGEAAVLPVEQLKSPAGISDYLGAFKTASGSSVSVLIVDVKAAGGMLAYVTAYPGADAAKTLDFSIEQMAANVKTIQAAGVRLIARVHCFDDSLAGKFVDGAKVTLAGSTGYTWLDDSQDSGGRGWLNAYSTTAQDYLVTIIKEVAAAGFDGVLLDSVQLPVGYGLKRADYGANTATMTAEQALTNFINKAVAALPGTPVLLNTTARAVVDNELTPYGGVSPLSYDVSGLAGYTVTLNAPAMPRKQAPLVLTEEQKAAYIASIDVLPTKLPVITLTLQ